MIDPNLRPLCSVLFPVPIHLFRVHKKMINFFGNSIDFHWLEFIVSSTICGSLPIKLIWVFDFKDNSLERFKEIRWVIGAIDFEFKEISWCTLSFLNFVNFVFLEQPHHLSSKLLETLKFAIQPRKWGSYLKSSSNFFYNSNNALNFSFEKKNNKIKKKEK